MTTTADIWVAFARTFSILFVVLALLILIFYIIKKISTAGNQKSGSYINVLSMHHLSPKEKLVLLDVLGEIILVGVTPSQISKLTSIKTDMDFSKNMSIKNKTGFSQMLAKSLGRFRNEPQTQMGGERPGT